MRARSSVPLGGNFYKLWTASTVSNVGDGVTLVAGPLLVTSLTNDPALISGAVFVQSVPWLLFSVVSGAYVDRVERRQLIAIINILRGVVLTVVTITIMTGTVSIPILYAAFFLLGTGETVVDTAAGALLPSVVSVEKLGSANSLLMASFTIGNQLLAKPFGAYLFLMAAVLPFGFNGLTFFLAAALVFTMRPTPPAAPASGPSNLRRDVIEGVCWLWRNRLLRTLALCLSVGNIAYCGAFAIFILYARIQLGVSEVGYGFLLTTFAVGGLLGSIIANRLDARFGAATLLRAGLVVEILTHLTLALTTRPWVAAAALILFGIHTMVWGVIVMTLRQRLVPARLLGRVNGVYALFDAGGAALGALLGGIFARVMGIVAPFWIAAGMMFLVTIATWRPLGQSFHASLSSPLDSA